LSWYLSVLAGFISGVGLNGILLLQIILYWSKTQSQERAEALADQKKKSK